MRAIATVTSKGYLDFTETFLYSLWENGNVQDVPLIIIYSHGNYQQLEDNEKDELKKFWPGEIVWYKIDYDWYLKNKKWEPHYFALECFRMSQYEKLFYVDSDMICVRPVNKVFELNDDLAMTWEMPRQQYNAGAVLTSKHNRNIDTYASLMRHQKRSETFGRDQAVINEYFKGRITRLSQEYNCMPYEIGSYSFAALWHLFFKPNKPESRERYGYHEAYDTWQTYFSKVQDIRGRR